MRYLVLSDLHANLQALEAVLLEAPPAAFDRVLVLGDLVGYGADPNEVVDRVRMLAPHAIIRGNHDKVAAGIDDPESFNPSAREAALWTEHSLTATNRAYVHGLERGPLLIDEHIEIWHGAPDDEDFYIFTMEDVYHASTMMRRPLGLFGHTHVQAAYRVEASAGPSVVRPDMEGRVTFGPGQHVLVNPGSVGQPRDGDPRAAYAVVDTAAGVVELRRVDYPITEAQEKILQAGLPLNLASRLAVGR
jgi:predicted phosphodiesterase